MILPRSLIETIIMGNPRFYCVCGHAVEEHDLQGCDNAEHCECRATKKELLKLIEEGDERVARRAIDFVERGERYE